MAKSIDEGKELAMSAWAQLPTWNDDGSVLAVIEATGESRFKFKFEPKYGVFLLHAVLPTGTSFPYAFGFVPGTLGEDGDPLDILVLADESPPVGTVVPCRLVAVLEATQREKKRKPVRNDRLLAVAEKSERYARCSKKADIQKTVRDRIADFFAFYHGEQGKTFEPIGWKGAATARALLAAGIKVRERKA